MGKSNYQPLSKTERKYLKTGETESYSENTLRDNIRDKQIDIGHRLNRLADDLSLMRRSEYFDHNNGEVNIFEDLSIYKSIDLAFNNRIWAEPKISIMGVENDGVRLDQPKSAVDFGYYMGGLLSMITELLSEEHTLERALQGLVMFYFFVPDGKPVKRIDQLKELAEFDYVDHREDGLFARGCSGEWNYRIKSGYSKYDHNTKEMQFLQDQKIPKSEVICRVLRYPVNDENFPEDPSENEIFEKNLKKLQSIELFNKSINLNKTVISDIEYLEQPFRGPNRLDILEQMRTTTQKKKSYNIAKGIDKASQDNLVETALNKMSVECEDDDLWTTYPVVDKFDGEWEFTSYGALIAEFVIGNITIDDFARHGLPEEPKQHDLISATLAQTSKGD